MKAFAPEHRIVAKCEFMNPLSVKERLNEIRAEHPEYFYCVFADTGQRYLSVDGLFNTE